MSLEKAAQAKTISLSAKCSDCFTADFLDKDGNTLFGYDGYVPKFFPDQHWGDYVMLDIDLETGQIKNWRKPTVEELQALIPEEDEEDAG